MQVKWKIVTDNPEVTEKIKQICKNVMRMQHQPEACASDLGDSSHVTCGCPYSNAMNTEVWLQAALAH